MQPLALAESGVCKRQAASQGPKKQRGLRAPSLRETASVFLGGSRLMRAEGLAPKQSRREAENRRYAGRRETGQVTASKKKKRRHREPKIVRKKCRI